MAFPIDLTQWRVYSAEQSLPPGDMFGTIDDAATFLWWVQSTKWWKATFPDAPNITVRSGGNSNRSHGIQSFARPIADGQWEISLHPRMMNAAVLLHEVAHCVAPRMHGDIRKIRRDRLSFGEHHHHGPYFRGVFASLAERYNLGVDPQELRRAYAHFQLDTPDIDEVVAARAHSAEVEREVAAMWQRAEALQPQQHLGRGPQIDEERGEDEQDTAASAPASRVPPEWWGDWLWLSRRHSSPRMSQKRLADAVSPIVKCTVRDVARLERSTTAPKEPIDIQRCIAFVAVLGLDPVWAETHKELAAGENTITLDSLQSVAPEWVAGVRHLNELLAARPPRWLGEGNR